MDPQTLEKLRAAPTCDVGEAAAALGVSRGLAYEQAKTGFLGGAPVLRIGHHRLRVVTAPLLAALHVDDNAEVGGLFGQES